MATCFGLFGLRMLMGTLINLVWELCFSTIMDTNYLEKQENEIVRDCTNLNINEFPAPTSLTTPPSPQPPPPQSSSLSSTSNSNRLNQRYRIKGHLSAGAHGIILWAIERQPNQSSVDIQFDSDQSTKRQISNEIPDSSGGIDVADEDNHNQSAPISRCRPSNNILQLKRQFAIKRIFTRNRVVSLSIVREIKTLQFLRGHPNIIDLIDVCPFGCSINLIFPLLPLNLTTLIYDIGLNTSQCAIYCRMLATSVEHLHHNGIVHRDLKPSNLLIDWNGTLKLCDFGQARAIEIDVNERGLSSSGNHNQELSYQVCTRWYRAPELLYGSSRYDYSVDLWSVGCILAEMLQEWPLFKGDNDIEQLSLVVKALGQPKPEWTTDWPDFNKIQFTTDSSSDSESDHSSDLDQTHLSDSHSHRKTRRKEQKKWLQNLHDRCRPNRCTDLALDLMEKLCRYAERINASELLQHPYLNQKIRVNSAGHLVSITDNSHQLLDRYLVKAKYVKHLSGPPRNNND